MPSDAEKRNRKFQRHYLKLARKSIAKAEEHKLDFDTRWMSELTGVVRWVERNSWITDAQMRGIANAGRAIDNMVKYLKMKERRRRGKGDEEGSGPSGGA